MNKRFRELAFQAMSINQKVSDDSFFVEVSKLNEFEKFAELIVRECADIANRQFSAATGLDDRDCLTAHQMKQHFGVE